MSVIIALAALGLLMLAAYRGYSVILFAPLAALGAVLLTDPSAVAPTFTGVFMEKMVGFIKLYFPVFLLGAVFGKLIELAGFSRSIVAAAIRLLGTRQAMLVIVLVCALLTYGGVSLFVVVFAVYPFAAEMFRQSDIPKRLIPATIALGAFSFTMDALPGTPQIQNIIPSTFFGTHAWAAPWLGTLGALFVFAVGMLYLRRQANKARRNGEGYGSDLRNEPETADDLRLPNPWLALSPLVLVGVANLLFTHWIPQWYGQVHTLQLAGMATPLQTEVGKLTAIWAVQAALLLGILLVLASGFAAIRSRLAEGTRSAVAGSLLAAMNTASEYGFGAVIASLPGFLVLADALKSIPNPLVNEAITVTLLAGITGSASGGMSIALAAMSDTFIAAANAAQIPLEVLHRVAAMASGGMDTLPHNGAVITLLAVTGLTHREAYKDIFGITLIKTLAVFFVIGLFYATGLVCSALFSSSGRNSMTLKGKTALVTGSTSGIGLGIALSLAEAGADLLLNGFGEVDAALAQVRARGVRAEHHPADLSSPEQIGELMAFAERTFGGVDILVNNAGIQYVAPVQEFPTERWDAIIAINLSSVFHTTRLALPGMLARGWGRIVNIASTHGLVASAGKSAYVAAKHGVLGLTKSVALETARTPVTCNAICPGWVLTPLVQKQIDARIAEGVSPEQAEHDLLAEKQPSLAFVTPEQLGGLTLFLCSEAADQVRGAAWNMDGGWVAQ